MTPASAPSAAALIGAGAGAALGAAAGGGRGAAIGALAGGALGAAGGAATTPAAAGLLRRGHAPARPMHRVRLRAGSYYAPAGLPPAATRPYGY